MPDDIDPDYDDETDDEDEVDLDDPDELADEDWNDFTYGAGDDED